MTFAPLHIGPIEIGFPVVQAALSGYSDWPMRLLRGGTAHRSAVRGDARSVFRDGQRQPQQQSPLLAHQR